MTTSLAALDELGRVATEIGARPAAPDAPGGHTSATAAACEWMERVFADTRPRQPSLEDLEALDEVLRQASKEQRGLERIAPRQWRRAPWVLWLHPPYLASNPEVLAETLDVAREGSALRALIHVFLRDCRPDLPEFETVAAAVRKALEGDARSTRLRAWSARQREFDLFNLDRGPDRVAEHCLTRAEGPLAFLDAIGLGGELEPAGYAAAAFDRALHRIKLDFSRTGASDVLDALLAWGSAGKELRYSPKHRMPDALLRPWESGHAVPAEDVKDTIRNYLVEHLGDPRVTERNWQGVSDEARTVIYRWLTSATLETFFEVLDGVADRHADDSRLWRYRRAFWMAYHDRGLIEEAWLALGPQATRRARRVGHEAGALNGWESNRSVILMRIGNLVISEHSPMGRCRAWRANDRGAPPLYKNAYEHNEVMGGSLRIRKYTLMPGIAHTQSDAGGWQQHLESFIRKETGVAKLTRKAYMPKR